MQIRNTPAQPMVLLGNDFSYQLMITNHGVGPATGVLVRAILPEQVSYKQILGNYAGTFEYLSDSREILWHPGDLNAGQSETLTISVTADNAGSTAHLATVVSTEEDNNLQNNEATALVGIISLSIPNVFTPNGDGLNDYFEIRGLEFFAENRISIFNRWGNEVFKSNRYQNDWNGSSLAEGTYYYILELKPHTGRWQTFKGFITLIRNTNN
ncbi:T9SS type B sorting domain-containing protein [Parapedobacter tibetensis]|uniref:T9SS type B sorting domain-containing protein n=1 Tax=Parapedobacter tibetensis TaxID=2972951 RepID=UPI00214D82DB|nr:gliding motility-associated C-terminal domain-containing protein [Parapedobacter tibetensis]